MQTGTGKMSSLCACGPDVVKILEGEDRHHAQRYHVTKAVGHAFLEGCVHPRELESPPSALLLTSGSNSNLRKDMLFSFTSYNSLSIMYLLPKYVII